MDAITTATEADLTDLARFVARLQDDPRHHVGYLDLEVEALEAQLTGLEPLGLRGVLLARHRSDLVGMLAADWDEDPPRVWWHGPLVDPAGAMDAGRSWDAVADNLYLAAVELLPDTVTEEELFFDVRGEPATRFAERHGFERDLASAVLTRALTDPDASGRRDPATSEATTNLTGEAAASTEAPARIGEAGIEITGLDPADLPVIATLHDELFPGAHVPGTRVHIGEQRWVLVARATGANDPLGYVAVERQDDGQGYLDFLGVHPRARRNGVAAALVTAACDHGQRRGSREIHLTVREDNAAARRLYERLGFVEERVVVPWRRVRGVRPRR